MLFEDYIAKFPHTEEYRERYSGHVKVADRSLTNMYNYGRYSVPFRVGKHWYYSYNEGLQAQSIYYTLDTKTLDARMEGDVFFDPNILSEDGTISVSPAQI